MSTVEKCDVCREYDVPCQPIGMGGIGNFCEYCEEYSIPEESKEDEDK
jgi:hypothetical protein